MIQFIIGITLIALLISYPSIMLAVLVILSSMYLYTKRPDLLEKVGFSIPPREESKEEDPDLPPEKKDFETMEEKLERAHEKIEKNMKPGYKDDPEWQRMSQELGEKLGQARAEADLEERYELLKEAKQAALDGRWSEVDRIERELADLTAKQQESIDS